MVKDTLTVTLFVLLFVQVALILYSAYNMIYIAPNLVLKTLWAFSAIVNALSLLQYPKLLR